LTIGLALKPNQAFHYTHRVLTPKRVTSMRCLSPRHSVKATLLFLRRCWTGGPVCNTDLAGPGFELQTSTLGQKRYSSTIWPIIQYVFNKSINNYFPIKKILLKSNRKATSKIYLIFIMQTCYHRRQWIL